MKIALFEISTSHEECIYSQVKFLTDSGHSVSLVLNKALENQIKTYANLCEHIHFIDPIKVGAFKKLQQQWKLAHILRAHEVVVFNTASSSKTVRNLVLLLKPFKVTCIGILHNGRKLNSSFTQRIISLKIKKYLVLSDQIAKEVKQKRGFQVDSFYPIFFPDFAKVDLQKKSGIWIGIPGRIDWKRRDYTLLIDAMKAIPDLTNIKFLLLGRLDDKSSEGQKLWHLIQINNLEDHFIVFDGFIANEDFHTYLKCCDYIMPLLSKNENYLRYKISGSFNLAYAYKKPLICNGYFKTLPDLQENGYFFDANRLPTLISNIHRNVLSNKNTYTSTKWAYTYQKNKYVNFVTNN